MGLEPHRRAPSLPDGLLGETRARPVELQALTLDRIYPNGLRDICVAVTLQQPVEPFGNILDDRLKEVEQNCFTSGRSFTFRVRGTF